MFVTDIDFRCTTIFSAQVRRKAKILYPLWFLLIVVFDRGVKTKEKNNSDGHLSEKS
jgi:hypothetical protein